MFATRNPVVLNTKQIEVNVRPIPPANNGNWWLPAESVKLYAEWSPQRPVFKVGEAVSRTVYLKAVGVVENQLPDIKFRDVAGLKQYPEKPVAQNAVENGQVVAVKKNANVYIPDKAGNIAVPEISVDWFNVRTGRMERAVLPAANIQVQPGNVSVAAQPQTMEPDMNRRGEILADSAEEAVETVAAELPVSPETVSVPTMLQLRLYSRAGCQLAVVPFSGKGTGKTGGKTGVARQPQSGRPLCEGK